MKIIRKRLVLKRKVENFLTGIVMLFISFVAMTIDNVLDFPIYDLILVIGFIICLGIMKILVTYGRDFDEK